MRHPDPRGTTRPEARRRPAGCRTPRESCGASEAKAPPGRFTAGALTRKRARPPPMPRRTQRLRRCAPTSRPPRCAPCCRGYDERELVTIRSGAGGVNAARLGQMLMRMYPGRRTNTRRGVRHAYAEKARHQKAPRSCARHRSPTARCPVEQGATGWCGSARSATARAGDGRRSPRSPKCCRWWGYTDH